MRLLPTVSAVMVLAVGTVNSGAEAGSPVPFKAEGQRFRAPVTSFLELREAGLVRQGWDVSCGAAALSTILTYHHENPYNEATIAVSMLSNTDPKKVRARGGFSLLDLKRFSEAVGYSAKGYGGMTLDNLAESSVPAILPVRIRDYDHFIVFRGRAGNRVLIGDPAFGNLTIRIEEFLKMWSNGIAFFVYDEATPDSGLSPLSPNEMNMMVPNLNFVFRTLRGGGPVPATRRPRTP